MSTDFLNLAKPTIGGSKDVWGEPLNINADKIDADAKKRRTWNEPAVDFAGLPTGTYKGELRVTLDDLYVVVWDGSTWQYLATRILGTKEIDESALADGKIIAYSHTLEKLIYIENGTIIKGIPVDDSGKANGTYLKYIDTPTPKFIFASPAGSGDMLKSVYDSEENGTVNSARALGTKQVDESAIADQYVIAYDQATDKLIFVPGSGGGVAAHALTHTYELNPFYDSTELSNDGYYTISASGPNNQIGYAFLQSSAPDYYGFRFICSSTFISEAKVKLYAGSSGIPTGPVLYETPVSYIFTGVVAINFFFANNFNIPTGEYVAVLEATNNDVRVHKHDTLGSFSTGVATWDGATWTNDNTKTLLAAALTYANGTDQIDGDQLDIDFVPTNFNRDITPVEVNNIKQLTAHLKGIDNKLGSGVVPSVHQDTHTIETKYDQYSNISIDGETAIQFGDTQPIKKIARLINMNPIGINGFRFKCGLTGAFPGGRMRVSLYEDNGGILGILLRQSDWISQGFTPIYRDFPFYPISITTPHWVVLEIEPGYIGVAKYNTNTSEGIAYSFDGVSWNSLLSNDFMGASVRYIEGSDVIITDRLNVGYSPVNYTKDGTAPIITSPNQLAAHLKGIDNKLVNVDQNTNDVAALQDGLKIQLVSGLLASNSSAAANQFEGIVVRPRVDVVISQLKVYAWGNGSTQNVYAQIQGINDDGEADGVVLSQSDLLELPSSDSGFQTFLFSIPYTLLKGKLYWIGMKTNSYNIKIKGNNYTTVSFFRNIDWYPISKHNGNWGIDSYVPQTIIEGISSIQDMYASKQDNGLRFLPFQTTDATPTVAWVWGEDLVASSHMVEFIFQISETTGSGSLENTGMCRRLVQFTWDSKGTLKAKAHDEHSINLNGSGTLANDVTIAFSASSINPKVMQASVTGLGGTILNWQLTTHDYLQAYPQI